MLFCSVVVALVAPQQLADTAHVFCLPPLKLSLLTKYSPKFSESNCPVMGVEPVCEHDGGGGGGGGGVVTCTVWPGTVSVTACAGKVAVPSALSVTVCPGIATVTVCGCVTACAKAAPTNRTSARRRYFMPAGSARAWHRSSAC